MKTKILYTLIVSLFIIGCKSTTDTTSTNTETVFDINAQPKAGPAPTINLGKPQTFELPNGLKVMVVENHKLPRVSATLTIDNGLIFEGDKAGVLSLTGSVLGSGTTSTSKDNFNEEVDFLGANVSFSSQGARMSSLSKYFPKVLGLMADGALNPLFPQEDFDSQQNQLIEGIKGSVNDVSSIANQVQGALVYGKNHPKGEFITAKTAANVTLDDVKSFYNKYYNPNNAYLIVIGDVNFNEVKKLVTSKFSGWEKGDAINYTVPQVDNVAKTEIDFIDMPNAVQSNISITNTISLKKADPDYYAALLANKILGGGGVARLFQNLRETNGFTYGAYSSLGNDHETASRFSASAKVRNMVTDSSVVEFLNEIKKIRVDLVSDEELKIAKAAYVGNFVRALERPSTVAGYALNIETEGLSKSYYENYLKNINAVTAEQVRTAANKFFKEDNLRIIIVGKGADVIPSLEKMGLPVNYFDKGGNPTQKPEMNKLIPKGVTLQTIADSFVAAIGGKDKIDAIKSVVHTSKAEMQGMILDMTTKFRSPNSNAVIVGMGGNVMQKNVFNGVSGYEEARGQKKPLEGDKLDEAKNGSAPFEELSIVTNGELIGIENINGRDNYVVKTGKSSKVYFDVESGLKTQVANTSKGPDGKETTQIMEFSEYKEVNGVKFPHLMKMAMGPATLEFKTTEIKINEGITDADFE